MNPYLGLVLIRSRNTIAIDLERAISLVRDVLTIDLNKNNFFYRRRNSYKSRNAITIDLEI